MYSVHSVRILSARIPLRMVLTAPATYEEELLKPILMGRWQVIKVRFVPAIDEVIQLQLFLAAAGN